MRFGRRITLSVLLMVAGTSAIGAIIAHDQVRRAQDDGFMTAFDLEAQATQERQALRLDLTRQSIRELSNNSFLFGALVEEDWADLYGNATHELRALRALEAYFLDADGRPVPVPGEELTPLMTMTDAQLPRVSATDEGAWSRAACVLINGDLVEVLRHPVIDTNTDEVVGWIVAAWPWNWPTPSDSGTDGPAQMLHAVMIGDELALPRAQPLADWLHSALVPAIHSGQQTLTSPDGTPYLLQASPLDVASHEAARFIGLRSLREAHAAQQRTTYFFLGASLVSIVAGAAVSRWMGRSLSRPVQQLDAAAHQVGHGDYSVRLRLTGADEFVALGSTFNEMAHGLSMRDRYRNVLDAVADPAVAEELIGGEMDLKGRTVEAGVLFCDIRGFTATTESMTPDEVIAMLNGHMGAMCEVIYRHGGMVDKFVGDLVMAVWGAPRSAGDDALRMARCALDMQATREALNRSTPRPIHIGIGIAYGPVVAGCMGSSNRMNYTVLGARVNLASRLCSAATAGHVVADEGVQRQLDASITPTALEPFAVKGFTEPVRAYTLSRGKAEHS